MSTCEGKVVGDDNQRTSTFASVDWDSELNDGALDWRISGAKQATASLLYSG